MHSMKYVQSKLFLSDCTKGATSSRFLFYMLVANKGIPANSHVLLFCESHASGTISLALLTNLDELFFNT